MRRTFPGKNSTLAVPSPSVLSRHTGLTNYAMAWDQICQRVLAHGSPDGPGAARTAYILSKTLVTPYRAGEESEATPARHTPETWCR